MFVHGMGLGGLAVDVMVVGCLGAERRVERFFALHSIMCFPYLPSILPQRTQCRSVTHGWLPGAQLGCGFGCTTFVCEKASRGVLKLFITVKKERTILDSRVQQCQCVECLIGKQNKPTFFILVVNSGCVLRI